MLYLEGTIFQVALRWWYEWIQMQMFFVKLNWHYESEGFRF